MVDPCLHLLCKCVSRRYHSFLRNVGALLKVWNIPYKLLASSSGCIVLCRPRISPFLEDSPSTSSGSYWKNCWITKILVNAKRLSPMGLQSTIYLPGTTDRQHGFDTLLPTSDARIWWKPFRGNTNHSYLDLSLINNRYFEHLWGNPTTHYISLISDCINYMMLCSRGSD